MRVLSFFLLGFVLLSCNVNHRSNDNRHYISNDSKNEIKNVGNQEVFLFVDEYFKPTLELTDEIKNSSLEDLIRQDKGRFTADELKKIVKYIKIYITLTPNYEIY